MSLTKDEVYDIWRPKTSPWARWVKPVLFSFLREEDSLTESEASHLRRWDIPFEQETAIVADLPGAEGIWAGMALAKAGYRPIPVYNACPPPAYAPDAITPAVIGIGHPKPFAAVDVESLVRSISQAAPVLREAALPDEAPPAFLIDKGRKGHGRPDYGWFDNRSFVTASEFPSAEFLKQRGIRRVVLVGTHPDVGYDLNRVLLSWQGFDIQITYQRVWHDWRPEPKRILRPGLLRRLWERLLLVPGHATRENGAFGEWVRASSG